jgi:TATA-binding protein-associated factor Taf7
MNSNKRNGNRWTVNELLSLQREYELLEWTIQQIAVKHQRTERAILFRLESEGFITSWNDARGFDMESYKASIEDNVVTEDCVCNEESCVDDDVDEEQEDDDEVEDQDCCDDDEDYVADEEEDEEDEEEEDEEEEDDVSEVEKLSERVWSLETAVTDIKDMVQHLFNNLVSSNQKKRKPLRKPVVEQH